MVGTDRTQDRRQAIYSIKEAILMSNISPINSGATQSAGRVRSEQVSRPDAAVDHTRARPARSKDQVQFSNVARYLSELKTGPAERSDLIDRVRQEIDAGQYDTPEKLEAAIDGIKEDLEFTL